MPTNQASPLLIGADGLLRKLEQWGEILTGTRAQLLNAGIVEPSWLPGVPGNNRRTQRVVIEDNEPPKLITGQGRSGGKQYRGEAFLIMKKSENVFTVRHEWPYQHRDGVADFSREFHNHSLLAISRTKAVDIIYQAASRHDIKVRLVGYT